MRLVWSVCCRARVPFVFCAGARRFVTRFFFYRYKAKARQAVTDSKEAFCAEEAAEAPEWSFVV